MFKSLTEELVRLSREVNRYRNREFRSFERRMNRLQRQAENRAEHFSKAVCITYRRVGGLRFLRIGRLNVSFSVSRSI
jgi:hypothetical protein